MDGDETRKIQVNFTVGLFLIGSGAAIHFIIPDTMYGSLCLGVGILFLAKSLAGIRLSNER